MPEVVVGEVVVFAAEVVGFEKVVVMIAAELVVVADADMAVVLVFDMVAEELVEDLTEAVY